MTQRADWSEAEILLFKCQAYNGDGDELSNCIRRVYLLTVSETIYILLTGQKEVVRLRRQSCFGLVKIIGYWRWNFMNHVAMLIDSEAYYECLGFVSSGFADSNCA